jgi:hypothetical protein
VLSTTQEDGVEEMLVKNNVLENTDAAAASPRYTTSVPHTDFIHHMLIRPSSTSAWRLSCTVQQDGAMILSAKIPTRFTPILNLRRCSRPHATCIQSNVDQVELDSIQHQLNLRSPVDTLSCILLNDTRPLARQMQLRSLVKGALKVDFPINGQMLDANQFRQYVYINPRLVFLVHKQVGVVSIMSFG